jgi:hypothetical protein
LIKRFYWERDNARKKQRSRSFFKKNIPGFSAISVVKRIAHAKAPRSLRKFTVVGTEKRGKGF